MSSPAMVGTLTNQQTNASEHLMRDVSSVLAKYEPDIYPLDSLLRQTEMIGQGKSQVHEWASVTSWPRKDTTSAAVSAGGTKAAVDVPVHNVSYWKINDIIYIPSLAKADATVPNLIVTDIDTDNGHLVVKALGIGADAAGKDFADVPAIPEDAVLSWIGNAKAEGAQASSSRGQAPGYAKNYMQILDAVIDITGSREAVKNFTNVQDWDRSQKEQVGEFRKSLESTLWFSKMGYTEPSTGVRRYTMGGVDSFVTEHATYEISQGLTESIIMDMLGQSFSGNNGSKTRILFADSYLSMAIQKSQLSKLQSLTSVTVAGVQCGKMVFPEGTVLLKHHRMFNELGLEHFGFIIDPKNIKKQQLRAMEKTDIDYKKQGYDKKGIWLLEESTIEVTNPTAHLKIYGV